MKFMDQQHILTELARNQIREIEELQERAIGFATELSALQGRILNAYAKENSGCSR